MSSNRAAKCTFFVVILTACVSPLKAHGLRTRSLDGNGVGLEVVYESGQPLVDAEVKLYSPGHQEEPVLRIRTDRNGRFMFVPDRSGTWVAVVRDGSGHGVRYDFDVDDAMRLVGRQSTGASLIASNIVAAACVIWGFVGTAFFFRRRSA
ncbi:MAG: hypothetical protein GF344_05060 [Chitinivibrionales bacterium]|nr:hypothetical protein [Chitinivibrionales bacterium]MBD3356368.1 hypothetical protein [Chitinivibrionales bacterium]